MPETSYSPFFSVFYKISTCVVLTRNLLRRLFAIVLRFLNASIKEKKFLEGERITALASQMKTGNPVRALQDKMHFPRIAVVALTKVSKDPLVSFRRK